MTTMVAQQRWHGPPTPVPIFQWETEFSELLDLYRKRKPKRVLEVGTFHGGTLYHWLQNATPGTRVVSVDSYTEGIDNREFYASWCPVGVSVKAIEGISQAPATVRRVQALGPYEWIWIDAGHLYSEVSRDWELYRPMCAEGGVVCFHDILPPSSDWPQIEVSFLWDEIKAAGMRTREIIDNPHATWGGIGIVYV